MKNKKNNDFASELIDGLEEALKFEKGKKSLRTTHFKTSMGLSKLTSKELKNIRENEHNDDNLNYFKTNN